MLKISDQVFGQFADASEARFVRKLADFLLAVVPDLSPVPSEVHEVITRQVIDDARSHGFVTEQDIARYALCAALLGPDFLANFPGAREILEMKESASYRARLLEYFTRELFETLET